MAMNPGLFSRVFKLSAHGTDKLGTQTTYTQTYATADTTVPAATTHTITDSTGGTASTTTLVAIGGTYSQSEVRNNFATVAAEQALANADLLALKKVVNKIIDDLQAQGYVL